MKHVAALAVLLLAAVAVGQDKTITAFKPCAPATNAPAWVNEIIPQIDEFRKAAADAMAKERAEAEAELRAKRAGRINAKGPTESVRVENGKQIWTFASKAAQKASVDRTQQQFDYANSRYTSAATSPALHLAPLLGRQKSLESGNAGALSMPVVSRVADASSAYLEVDDVGTDGKRVNVLVRGIDTAKLTSGKKLDSDILVRVGDATDSPYGRILSCERIDPSWLVIK